jgi:hypothetical protein
VKRQQALCQAKGSVAGVAVSGVDGQSQQQLRILSMPLGSVLQRYRWQTSNTTQAETAAVATGIIPLRVQIEGHRFETQVFFFRTRFTAQSLAMEPCIRTSFA